MSGAAANTSDKFLNMLGEKVLVERVVTGPFLNKREICRIVVVLHQLVVNAPGFGPRRFDQRGERGFRLIDLIGFRP